VTPLRTTLAFVVASLPAALAIPLLAAQAEPPRQGAAGERFVVIGCVARETSARGGGAAGPVYVIRDQRADPPLVYQLRGDDGLLDFHVGHTVELKGTIQPVPAGSDPPRRTFTVESLIYIATRCAD
jgi:hypothetical protein